MGETGTQTAMVRDMDRHEAHRNYLAHLQTQIAAAHEWAIKCFEAGTEKAMPGEIETASLPRSLAMTNAVDYLRVAWKAKGSKKSLTEKIAGAEVASTGTFSVPVYGRQYAGGVGGKPVAFNRYSLESLDQIGAILT